jgi:hypothetical protein
VRRGAAVFDVTRQQPAIVVHQHGPWLTLVRPGRRPWRTHVAAVRPTTVRERKSLRALRRLVRAQRERELWERVREMNERSRKSVHWP